MAAEADGWDPSQVIKGSNKKLPWKCKLGHTWETTVITRTRDGRNCPYCSGNLVWPGFNDLLTTHPEIAKEAYGWDPKKYSSGSGKKVKWIHAENHIWESSILNRVFANSGCPYCHGTKVLAGFNDLATTHPEIAKEADNWDPTSVTAGSNRKKKWVCLNGHSSFSQTVINRTNSGQGCPKCAEHGYNPDKEGWMYLMNRPGEQQFGISNVIEDRLRFHRRRGWSEIEVVGPYSGKAVLETETELKSWLRKEIGLIEGTSENWLTTNMEVQSLRELFTHTKIEPRFPLH